MRTAVLLVASLASLSWASPTALQDRAPNKPAVAPLYACKQSSDCVVRDVGNCCGSFPVCANAKATIPPPCPNGGGFSICGFPQVDTCKCGTYGGCVSYQSGTIVNGAQYTNSTS